MSRNRLAPTPPGFEWHWDELPVGSAFFVPTLDPVALSIEGLRWAVAQLPPAQAARARGKPAIYQGRLGVMFSLGRPWPGPRHSDPPASADS